MFISFTLNYKSYNIMILIYRKCIVHIKSRSNNKKKKLVHNQINEIMHNSFSIPTHHFEISF